MFYPYPALHQPAVATYIFKTAILYAAYLMKGLL